ncbi:MAG TPA: hypothetical protein PKV16_06245 [Caldisericia bacterium]|nr:hypothetical protein [Caldisericia bacterium]HPF49210.1 hypothetical protein [Caldisericia bacterium]HPI84110.1 hypothetical protein [Caldisericia bacterium]HPQ93368.1 hypothetical protein [Caldisericia bacterium]HRV75250.1 hypothetical protein [Caldisericia bacterium]
MKKLLASLICVVLVSGIGYTLASEDVPPEEAAGDTQGLQKLIFTLDSNIVEFDGKQALMSQPLFNIGEYHYLSLDFLAATIKQFRLEKNDEKLKLSINTEAVKKPTPEIEVELIQTELLTLINGRRDSMGLDELNLDDGLTGVAFEFSKLYSDDESFELDSKTVVARLDELGVEHGFVNVCASKDLVWQNIGKSIFENRILGTTDGNRMIIDKKTSRIGIASTPNRDEFAYTVIILSR